MNKIGKYSRDQCHIDLEVLCSWARVAIIHAEVYNIDTVNKKVKIFDMRDQSTKLSRRKVRPSISYDVLSIDIGKYVTNSITTYVNLCFK